MDSQNYYGIPINPALVSDRWKWQVTLPIGTIITSNQVFATADLAIEHGRQWISAEMTFSSLNSCLSELCGQGALQRQEYCNLMASFLQIAHHA